MYARVGICAENLPDSFDQTTLQVAIKRYVSVLAETQKQGLTNRRVRFRCELFRQDEGIESALGYFMDRTCLQAGIFVKPQKTPQ